MSYIAAAEAEKTRLWAAETIAQQIAYLVVKEIGVRASRFIFGFCRQTCAFSVANIASVMLLTYPINLEADLDEEKIGEFIKKIRSIKD